MDMKERIKKVISHSVLATGVISNCFIFDYESCGNDPKLHSKLSLMEKMVEKYYNVVFRASYLGVRELQYK